MALRFIDGFGHYSTAQINSKWTNSANAIIIPGGGRYGNGCAKINVGPSGFMQQTFDNQASWVIGFALLVSGLPSTNTILVTLLDTGVEQVDLRINADGTLAVTRNGTSLTGGQSTVALRVGSWYYVEFKVTIAASIGANTCKVNVNNVNVINVTAGQNTKNTSNASANSIIFSGSSPTSLFTDLYIADGNGGTVTDFLGDSRVAQMLPSAAGDSTQWTAVNTGNNWAAQANNPSLGDGMYDYSLTPGQVDLYNLNDLTLSGTISGIQISTYARKDDAGARTIATAIKTGGSSFFGTTEQLSASYLFYSEVYEINPDTALAWTGSDLQALQSGVKLIG